MPSRSVMPTLNSATESFGCARSISHTQPPRELAELRTEALRGLLDVAVERDRDGDATFVAGFLDRDLALDVVAARRRQPHVLEPQRVGPFASTSVGSASRPAAGSPGVPIGDAKSLSVTGFAAVNRRPPPARAAAERSADNAPPRNRSSGIYGLSHSTGMRSSRSDRARGSNVSQSIANCGSWIRNGLVPASSAASILRPSLASAPTARRSSSSANARTSKLKRVVPSKSRSSGNHLVERPGRALQGCPRRRARATRLARSSRCL